MGVRKPATRTFLLATGLASAVGVVALPSIALAQSTCSYPFAGCTPTTPTGGTTPSTPAPATKAATSSLPFTGADVEQLAAIGGVAIIAGGLLVRRSRRRGNTANATTTSSGASSVDTTGWSQWPSDSTQG